MKKTGDKCRVPTATDGPYIILWYYNNEREQSDRAVSKPSGRNPLWQTL